MVLGPLLFALALHAAIGPPCAPGRRYRNNHTDNNSSSNDANEESDEIRVIAYLDDIHILGSAAAVARTVPRFVEALAKIDLKINIEKNTFMAKDPALTAVGWY